MQVAVAYETPELNVHGSLEELTQGQSTGSLVDAEFVVLPGQPLPTFTFS